MNLEYFPVDPAHKNPVGGVEAGAPFSLFVRTADISRLDLILTKDGESPVRYPFSRRDGGFSIEMKVTTPGLYFYRFEADGEEFFAGSDFRAVRGEGEEWQLTAYENVFSPPDFLDGKVMYQIFPDRFCRGKKRYRTKAHADYRDDWGGTPKFDDPDRGIKVKYNDMFGGNLGGVTEKLDYLSSLGVGCIYLNPIFEAASNHKYDTGSYRRVDGDFGGRAALVRLINAAKKRGIKIILDGVFSHTGEDSVYFNRYGRYDGEGAYQSKDSPYYEWYDFRDYPDDYDCWWGIKTLPCVRENEKTFDEFINGEDGIIRSYMRLGIAGWRLDVADELPDRFLDRLAAAAKRENPSALVLGEVWEDASNKVAYSSRRRYLLGRQLDSVTNYPLMNAIIAFLRSGDAAPLARTVCMQINNYPPRVLKNLMNPLSTHDTVRVLTALSNAAPPEHKRDRANAPIPDRSEAIKRLKAAAVLQYTLPGVPCIYYGDEAGMEGYEDPFNRRCYPWGGADEALVSHYRALGRLRARPELNGGEFALVSSAEGVFAFSRGKMNVVCNASEKAIDLGGEKNDLVTGERLSSLPPVWAIAFLSE